MRLTLPTAADTTALGRCLGAALQPGDVVALTGPFGAGKTTLVQGVLEGLGSSLWLGSPSFALVNEYRPAETGARIPCFHFDLYRLDTADAVASIGLDDYLAQPAAVIIEWPSAAAGVLPNDHLAITLSYQGAAREAHLATRGPRSHRLNSSIPQGGSAKEGTALARGPAGQL